MALLFEGCHKLLKDILRREGKELVNFESDKGCKPGDNFLGDIIRVSITSRDSSGELAKQSLIFKRPPGDRGFRDGLQSIKFGRNEEAFYKRVVPVLDKFLLQTTKTHMPVAQCFYSLAEDGEEDVLILEDLKVQGFLMADRLKGLDSAHCLLVLKELGRVHATSLAMQKLQPEQFYHARKQLRETLYFYEGAPQFATINLPCEATVRMLQSQYPDRTDYVKKLERYTADYFNNMCKIVETPTPLAVINFGDCWVNNFLFRYCPDGKPTELRFIDFQLSRFGSLVFDLSYLLYNSCLRNVLDDNWDAFQDAYVESLNNTLAQMGAQSCSISRQQLDNEWRRFGWFGLASAVVAVPFFVTPMEEQPKMEGGLEVFDKFHANTHKNPMIRERLTSLVEHAIEKGIL